MQDTITGPFLTDLDDRARVKDSRDPLSAQAIWTHFGRQVVGNLTTVTTSLRDFTALILGYYFADRVGQERGSGSELATFLKWEQLESYCRAYFNEDYDFRGTERVRGRLESDTRITLSTAQDSQILSDQKTYGLWGLYSVASASSDLVEQSPPRLTPPALEFVERHYLPRFGEAGFPKAKRLVQLLSRDECHISLLKADRTLCECIAGIMNRRVPTHEKEFYRSHLVDGGPSDSTQGRQPLLAKIMLRKIGNPEPSWSPGLVRALAKEAKAKSQSAGDTGEQLAGRLERIAACETMLAPAATLYAYLQGFHGQPLEDVAKRIENKWGAKLTNIDPDEIRALRPELVSAHDDGSADRFIKFADAMVQGAYATALRLLIKQNEATMKGRNGAAWIEERSGKLHVRVRDEQGLLPAREQIRSLWRFPYFLDSLHQIARQTQSS